MPFGLFDYNPGSFHTTGAPQKIPQGPKPITVYSVNYRPSDSRRANYKGYSIYQFDQGIYDNMLYKRAGLPTELYALTTQKGEILVALSPGKAISGMNKIIPPYQPTIPANTPVEHANLIYYK